LVCAAANRWREPHFKEYAVPALCWLEQLGSPMIVAPVGRKASAAYRLYVPNNAADLVAAAWARGSSDASIAEHRVEKDVRPTRLVGGNAVHFLWPVRDSSQPEVSGMIAAISAAARSITHLGWGIDMVAGNASLNSVEEAEQLPGERWRPVGESSASG